MSGTSRSLVALASLLVLAGLLPGPAAAAPERGALVVEGRGGTTTEWVVQEHTVVAQPMPTLSGGGDYAGVLVEALAPRSGETGLLGAIQVRAFGDRTQDAVAPLGIDGSLEPGRYRVRLFGEGSVRVRWQLQDDHPGLHVVPTTRMPVTFLGRAELLPAGQGTARVDLPASAPVGKHVLMTTLLDGTAAQDLRMCATTAQECPGGAPLCLPSPVPCDLPVPRASLGSGEPRAMAQLVRPAAERRALRWSVEGYHLEGDRLRAAALVF